MHVARILITLQLVQPNVSRLSNRRAVAYTGFFFGGGGGVQQLNLRTEGREKTGSGGGSPPVRGSALFANE
jgi:hypothetical protein